MNEIPEEVVELAECGDESSMQSKTVYVSVGDDGGGPFALARGIVSGLLEQAKAHSIKLNIIIEGWSGEKEKGRHESLLDYLQPQQYDKGAEFVERNKLIWIERDKKKQWVNPEDTKNEVLLKFPEHIKTYLNERSNFQKLSNADLVIGVVDPCIIAAAKSQGKKSICVTDHTWDVTMRLILEQVSLLDAETQSIIHQIGALYAQADCLYMWPEPVTPDCPFFEGAKELGVDLRRLPGVLEAPKKSRAAVQESLNIQPKNRNLPTVCLSSGALGALGEIFKKVCESYKEVPPEEYNVVIDAEVDNIRLYPVFQPGYGMLQLRSRPLPLVDQCMAYDLLITRAGGGAVNAAIASACPWVSVTEPLHPQVNAIAQCARRLGLARCIPYEVFEQNPRSVIERELLDNKVQNKKIISKLYEHSWEAKIRFAEGVIREFFA